MYLASGLLFLFLSGPGLLCVSLLLVYHFHVFVYVSDCKMHNTRARKEGRITADHSFCVDAVYVGNRREWIGTPWGCLSGKFHFSIRSFSVSLFPYRTALDEQRLPKRHFIRRTLTLCPGSFFQAEAMRAEALEYARALENRCREELARMEVRLASR
jgi:hypothetical protein